MKIEELKHFDDRLSLETEICRYLSFSKFIDLVETQALFFPLARALPDEFEGLPHDRYSVARTLALAEMAYGTGATALREAEIKRMRAENVRGRQLRSFTAISCWTLFDRESYLMWQAYSSAIDGIAVVSTIGDLLASLQPPTLPLYLRKTSYDRTGPFEGIEKDFIPFFCKRALFEDEREIRLVADLSAIAPDGLLAHRDILGSALAEDGLSISLDTERAIKRIILAPKMPARLERHAQKIAQRLSPSLSITQSELREEPIGPWQKPSIWDALAAQNKPE